MTQMKEDSMKKRPLTKACSSCSRSFDAFHWKYSCCACQQFVCRNCTVKVSWKKKVCWKCVIAAQNRVQDQSNEYVPVLDGIEGSTCYLPPPETTSTHYSEDYFYMENLTCRSRGQSSVDSFLEDGGLRVSSKFSDDDLQRYSSKFSSRSCDTIELDFDWVHPFPKAPRPTNDASRIDCIRRLDFEANMTLLQPDPFFFKKVNQAMEILHADMGSFHLVGEEMVHNLACTGYSPVFEMEESIPREEAACAYGILSSTPLIVLDTSNDPRFRAHPLAVEQNASTYITIPIFVTGISLHKECIGTIDMAHHVALGNQPTPCQLKELQSIASSIGMYIERRCMELNQIHDTNRGRRQTAPLSIGTIEEETGIDSNRGSSKTKETLQSLWDRAMETSQYMRATLSGNMSTRGD